MICWVDGVSVMDGFSYALLFVCLYWFCPVIIIFYFFIWSPKYLPFQVKLFPLLVYRIVIDLQKKEKQPNKTNTLPPTKTQKMLVLQLGLLMPESQSCNSSASSRISREKSCKLRISNCSCVAISNQKVVFSIVENGYGCLLDLAELMVRL